jgi:uncharacterized membrane protein YeaQ/YmgE (transglycosylase-associated protein family)
VSTFIETVVFVLVGLLAGATAAGFLPAYFRCPRSLTVATGVVSALVGGLIARTVLGGGHEVASTAVAAVTAGLLVSVLARPDQVPHGAHRRPRRETG